MITLNPVSVDCRSLYILNISMVSNSLVSKIFVAKINRPQELWCWVINSWFPISLPLTWYSTVCPLFNLLVISKSDILWYFNFAASSLIFNSAKDVCSNSSLTNLPTCLLYWFLETPLECFGLIPLSLLFSVSTFY